MQTDLAPQLVEGETQYIKITELSPLISGAINLVLIIGSIFVLIYFIWGAYQWLMSGGDKNQISAARTRLSHAVIGFILLASSWIIFLNIHYFLGLGGAGEEGTGPIALPSGYPKGVPRNGNNGNNGNLLPGYGNPNCQCWNGGCADSTQKGPLSWPGNPGVDCYQCLESDGWHHIGYVDTDECPPITCHHCP